MIIDYKYHIASLVAVFLALGIGILIGSTLLGNNSLVEYQKQVTNSLENQLQSLREANETIQTRANTLEMDSNINKQFEERVLPLLVDQRLAEKKYAVIELNGYGFPPELTQVIRDAGAVVSSVTTMEALHDMNTVLAETRQELEWDVTPDELYGKLGIEIAVGLIGGDNEPVIDFLKNKELLKVTGEYGIPVDGVIIIGGGYKEVKRNHQVDLALIDYFKELNIPVIGVEETDVSFSSMKEYQRKHISTVDNIDTAPGRLAVVFALGGQTGNYGVKPTAQNLLPDLKTNQEVN